MEESMKVMELRKITEFRNSISSAYNKNSNSEISLGLIKNLLNVYGDFSYPFKPFDFKLTLRNERIIKIDRGGETEITEADSVSMLELLENFKNDLVLC